IRSSSRFMNGRRWRATCGGLVPGVTGWPAWSDRPARRQPCPARRQQCMIPAKRAASRAHEGREDRLRRGQFLSLLAGPALAPLAASRVVAEARGGCGIPLARDDGWPVAAASEDRLVDRDALCRMADRLAATANVHAVVVARGGRLVFERYLKGT